MNNNGSNGSAALVAKLWNYCNLLRDDGLSYGDYVQQLTNLLFLKMAHERTLPPWNRPSIIPEKYAWPALTALDGDDLEVHYRHTLEALGKETGMLGVIFRKSQNKIEDPAKLRRLIADLIDKETWTGLDADIKGDAYEGLLEKNAQDTKSGAGQYFTPRPLIQAIVDVMRPQPGDTVADPACGTAGFLLAAHDYVSHHFALGRDQKKHLRAEALQGWEIVANTARLAAMNLMLHEIGSDNSPIHVADALAGTPSEHFSMILSNPPFGKKSSITVVNEEGKDEKEAISYLRDDFWATTSNKQLNFVQHIKSLLQTNGRAAVVVPDNVLFEGGAGETVRRKLLQECDVHTLLRLPTGIFYAQGVKANVLFFDRKPARAAPWTERLWVYDFRTNIEFTLKTNPLKRTNLEDFVTCYHADNRHDRAATWSEAAPEGRWRSFSYDELAGRDKASLDLFWLRDTSLEDSATLPAPELLAQEILEDLEAALDQFSQIADGLGRELTAV
jgi:type I restriction enzyme M protein